MQRSASRGESAAGMSSETLSAMQNYMGTTVCQRMCV